MNTKQQPLLLSLLAMSSAGSAAATALPASFGDDQPSQLVAEGSAGAARRFCFAPDHYRTPTVAEFRHAWRRLPYPEARNVVAIENQYLDFHRYLIESIRHQATTGGEAIPLGLSLRAGSLKAASLICGAIAEAALRAHAEARGYELPAQPRLRTLGRVLGAWQDRRKRPRADVAPIWDELQRLHLGRNNVHLYRTVEARSSFYQILAMEKVSLDEAERILRHLRELSSDPVATRRAATSLTEQ
jgi:hypothetical protein